MHERVLLFGGLPVLCNGMCSCHACAVPCLWPLSTAMFVVWLVAVVAYQPGWFWLAAAYQQS